MNYVGIGMVIVVVLAVAFAIVDIWSKAARKRKFEQYRRRLDY